MEGVLSGPLGRKPADLLNRRPVIAILATVDETGSPWTTPVNAITCMPGNAVIRMALDRGRAAYENLRRNDRVMLAVLDEGDVAVGISGRARVVKEAMNADAVLAMVEVDVCGVKDDTWADFVVCQGIRTRPRRESMSVSFRRILAELRDTPVEGGGEAGEAREELAP